MEGEEGFEPTVMELQSIALPTWLFAQKEKLLLFKIF